MHHQECSQCGSDEIVLDTRQGHLVCDNCGTVAQTSVVTDSYEHNRDYNGENFAPPTEKNTTYKCIRVNGKLRDVVVRCKRLEFARALIQELKREDCNDFPVEILATTEQYVDSLADVDYFKNKRNITILHVLAALLFVSHEVCGRPIKMVDIKTLFAFKTIKPVSLLVTEMRQKLDIPAVDMTLTQLFEDNVRKTITKDVKLKNQKGNIVKVVRKRVNKAVLVWRALEAASEHELMMRTQSCPAHVVSLLKRYEKESKNRKSCALTVALQKTGFDFGKLSA